VLLNRKPELPAALAVLCLYFASSSGHSYSIDGLLMYRQAVSIVHDHSLRFASPIYWGDNYFSSKYGIGLSLLYLPGVFLLSLMGLTAPVPQPNIYDSNLFYHDVVYTLGAAPVQPILTAATAYLVARFIRELGYGTPIALLGLIAYAVASPAIVYAREDFAQPLLAFCLMAALLAAVRFRRSGSWKALLVVSLALFLAVLTRPVEGSFLLPALVILMAPAKAPRAWTAAAYRTAGVLVGSYGVAVAITLLVNWVRFGSPAQTGYTMISWSTPIWVGLPGVLISPARGIIWQFPLVVMAPLGLLRLWRTGHQVLGAVLASLAVALLLNTALWIPWWGAWSWGSRLFVPAFPLTAALGAVGILSIGQKHRIWVTALLVGGGIVWAVPGTVTDLLSGYASAYDGSAQSFALSGYPPIGAWAFVHHLSSLDNFWIREAHRTNYFSLVVPVILVVLAAALLAVALRYCQSSSGGSSIDAPASLPEPM
jgi:hypothetical protein